jgi:hypothetical protein
MPDKLDFSNPQPAGGVAFAEPPADLQPALKTAIAEAVAQLAPGQHGALVGLVNEHGANAAVVARLAGTWEVQAWVGKSWREGAVAYGAAVRKSW